MKANGYVLTTLLLSGFLSAGTYAAESTTDGVATRFSGGTSETPDFQRHVVPLLGKMGCNGRACHGSFQGRGGFRLSLFGYDFKSDHEELTGRVDPETPAESLALQKPLMQIPHEGGQRLKENSWQHRVLLNWIKGDSPGQSNDAAKLTSLEVTPAEIQFSEDGQEVQLQAVAVWSDGTREVVTELCRFQSNDDQVADITDSGLVAAGTSGDTHVVVNYDNAVVPVPVLRPVSDQTGDKYPATPTPTEVDKLVVSKLRKLGMVQSDLCTDEEFLRRVSLDVTGALPTPQEISDFVTDTNSDKRAKKIDELLERPGYTAWWTTKLCDFTGNSDAQLNNVTPIRAAASEQWYDWIHARVEQNVPYDDIVEGLVMAESRDPGESYEDYCTNMSRLYHKDSDYSQADRQSLPHYWARRNFQQMEDRVIGFSYTFLGLRIQCAQCHKHPFDQWTQDDFKGFQGFFTGVVGRNNNARPDSRKDYTAMLAKFETGNLKGNQLRRELGKMLQKGETVPFGEVYTTPPPKLVVQERNGKKRKVRKGGGRTATSARLLGEEEIDLTQYEDVREPLMAWLRSPTNPMFSKAFVNRVWASYFNAGIVNPPDDLNLANPPSNAPLLQYLADGFIAHDFDMKWLHREILNSRTYQLSWKPNDTNRLDERNFSRAVPRRLPAEIAWDMVSQAVSNDEKYARFTSSNDGRAVAIPGAGTRYRNDRTGAAYALTIFGRSIRESNCDCDRSEEPSLLQTIFLRNDGQVLDMLDSRDGWLAQVAKENGVAFNAKSPSQSDRAAKAKAEQLRRTYANRVKAQQQAINKLKKQDGDEAKIARLEATLAKQKQKWRKFLRPADAEGPAASKQANENQSIDVAKAVTDAYLRTLSRPPTDDEAATAAEFITDAKDPLEGLRGVMWALLNTKEFIVNH
ncbi:DUF1549 domain-containing protein [Fuerstiella marisgermanici]|uniref:Cytochrome c domain-containing protein n=1 Tax=Fuerstiella marisgermanici TaxID=1891926 RepID=A0A1P8WHY8_9PLAN|nr:DUF1549 domain-containing protein [Fuerstiella marisgermanici]APZ93647.1 hypothetical protein Fuma_03265 [Fuerstiella marisgermanici]